MSFYFILLVWQILTAQSAQNGKGKRQFRGRKQQIIKVGRDALPWDNSNGKGFSIDDNGKEAQNWVDEQFERMWLEMSNNDDIDPFEILFEDLLDGNVKFEAEGIEFRGRKAVQRINKFMQSLSSIEWMDDKAILISNTQYSVTFKFDFKVARWEKPHTFTVTSEFKKNGVVKKCIMDTDGHVDAIHLKQFKKAFSAAFRATDIIGDFAKSAGVEDYYLDYIVYIFFTVLIGISIIIVLITAICIKVFCGLSNNKNKYKKVAATDTD